MSEFYDGQTRLGRLGAPAPQAVNQADELSWQLQRLRDMRDDADAKSKSLIARRIEFEATIAEAANEVRELRETIATVENEVRALVLGAYDGINKRPAPGVEIKTFAVVDYDASEAFDWALDHKLYLSLNKTEFERFAKSAPTMVPFATVREEPRVQIASDLGKALEGRTA